MRTRPGKIVLTLLFVAILWLPLAAMFSGQKQSYSVNEKRPLARFPVLQLTEPIKLSRDIEKFFNDHFGFRDDLIHWFHRIQLGVLDISTSGRVLKGKDGWLFQTGEPHFVEMRNAWPFGENELETWATTLQEKQDTLRVRGVRYLFVITANKHLVYPEKLPDSVKIIDTPPRAEQLAEYLRRHTDVPVLYLRPHLVAEKEKKELRLYHKTDTHWNEYGAYHGYTAIMDRLHDWFPGIPKIGLADSDFVTVAREGGDLARNLNLSDVIPEQAIEPRDWETDCAEYSGIKKDDGRQRRFFRPFTTECEEGGGRVLMLRDSYSLDLMPYLSETFEYIHYYPVSPRPLDLILELVEEHEPDVVIEQRASRWLRTPNG